MRFAASMKCTAWRILFFAVSLSVLSTFVCREIPAQVFKNKGNWESFKRNRSILGVTVGETPMKGVFAALGNAKVSQPQDEHDLSYACYKSPDGKMFMVFGTNYLHDSTILYSFSMSIEPPQAMGMSCVESKQLRQYPQTTDGIGIESTKADVLGKLGKPSSEKQNELRWEYEHYEQYDKPKIIYEEAGPTQARYLLKNTIKGAFNYPTITARFVNNKVVRFEVGAWGEADFFLERLPLDKK